MDRQCATCGKKFSRATTMRRHALSHASPEEGRTHKCHTCGKTFKRADRLSRHMKIHTGHDLKDCKHCGRGFRPDYLPFHHKSCRGRFEHHPDSEHLPEQRESRAFKEWCPSGVQQVNPQHRLDPQHRLEYSRLLKPIQFVNENVSSIWNMDREVRRAWRTDSIRSVDGAVRSAWDVIREAERLVRNDDVLGLKDLLNSLEPQWARVTTFLQLSIEATEETRDDGCWQDDNSRDMSLLEHATASGAFEVLRYLMSPWSNLEDAPRSRTILHRAVQRGHLEMMTFLVRDKDADLDLILESGDWELSPLAVAIESGDINIVKHLLDLGCNLQANCDDRSSPAVSFALREGSQDIAQWLIDQGASATNPDSEGRTPLHYAARAGALSLMRALLRLGADIDAGDKPYLETPLCVAAQYGQVDAMRFLLEAGAKAERISGQCPGSPVYAVYSGFLRCGSSALDLLVAWKVDLDRMYEDKSQMCTVLSWICRYSGSRSDGIGYLVGAGADINLGDRPPVLEAWQHGTVETVEFLLRSGAEYESLHLEKVPVEDPSWDPGRGHKKVLILQAWKEARTQAGSFSG